MPEQNQNDQEQKQGSDPVSGAIDTVNSARNAVQGIRSAIQGAQAIGAIISSFPVWGPILGVVAAAAFVIIIVVILFMGIGGAKPTEASYGGGNGSGPGSGSIVAGSPRGCPVTGYITTPYGSNIPGYPYPNHQGIDIVESSYASNPPVYNTMAGDAVQSVGNNNDQIVTVTNGQYSVAYHHLQIGSLVANGHVGVGDIIGNQDNTGNSTGNHVHYEVMINGVHQDPILYVPATIYYTQPPNDDFSGTSVPRQGYWGLCNTLPQDTTPGSGGSGPGSGPVGLNYYILYGDTSIVPADAQRIIDIANTSWPTNHINDGTCSGYANGCWDFVIQQSLANGISPAFTITIWWEEGGFGGANAKSEFGCFPGGNTSQNVDFYSSLACFINFTAVEHPYNPADPQTSFENWASYFCGPGAVPICSNNPNFLRNLRTTYESVSGRSVIPIP